MSLPNLKIAIRCSGRSPTVPAGFSSTVVRPAAWAAVLSQSDTVEEARSNLLKAVEGFFEAASPSEIRRRQTEAGSATITLPVPDPAELRTGTLSGIIRQSGLPRALFEMD